MSMQYAPTSIALAGRTAKQLAIFKLAVEYCDALVKHPVTHTSVYFEKQMGGL